MKYTIARNSGFKRTVGSALILAVVLSSLLAIVGVLFVMTARINKMATSAISQNKDLEFAVETVITNVSQQLILDIPGLISDNQEYYDYPDANNLWLANLEPFESGGNYYWQQISDVTGELAGNNRNVRAEVVSDYVPIPDSNNPVADADGDGISDSKWSILDEINSSSGKPVYVAVRIVDNSAMLNVNTGFKFDPSDPNVNIYDIDGKNQMQINIMSLAGWAGDPYTSTDEINLLNERANDGVIVNPYDLQTYLRDFVWRYDDPNNLYTPFDISDELEMRYRFLLNNTGIDTRLETWGDQFRDSYTLSTPVTSGGASLDAWFQKACNNGNEDPNYAYRHIATTYNMDRIINPHGSELNGGKMINVNTAAPELLYDAIRASLLNGEPGKNLDISTAESLAAQLAVNIVDIRDDDAEVSTFAAGPNTYYGFEAQPFISEIGFKISDSSPDDSDENSFALELYNPFKVNIPLRDFIIELRDPNNLGVDTIDLSGYVIRAESRFIITNKNDAMNDFGLNNAMSTGNNTSDPNFILAKYTQVSSDPPTYELSERYDIHLFRNTSAERLYLDKQETQDNWFDWDDANDTSKFYSRSDMNWNIVYQDLISSGNTLGFNNSIAGVRKNYNLANSTDFFISIGDIARAFIIGPGTDANDMIGVRLALEPDESKIRMDLRDPLFARLFRFLTVIDPTEFGLPASETRIKGRININTAPWFVMAQLPWMEPSAAQSIEPFRDAYGAFDSIADLMQVPEMAFYAIDPAYSSVDLDRWPDLTPGDGAVSDFEERDLIFSRISNLITVRSDVFTAYILVRIGLDGPQKRAVAILDRSSVTSSNGRIKLLAIQPVPDPR